MTHAAVSTPTRSRAFGTSGRPLAAHLVAQPRPQLGEEAERLLDVAAAAKLHALKFAEVMLANPSRAGVEALAHLGWSFRADSQKKYPARADAAEFEDARAMEKAAKDCTASVEAKDRALVEANDRALVEARETRLRATKTAAAALVEAFRAGEVVGRETAKKEFEAASERPVRRTEFLTDETGTKITGKIEYEFGGKK